MTGINLASAWETVADYRGDAPALIHANEFLSWTDFENRSARLAAGLGAAGVGPGDNVALALYNGNEYIEAEFATFKCRAAPCNVNYRYVESELAYLVDNSDAKAVVFDNALTGRFAAVVDRSTKVALWIHVGAGACPDWATPYEELVAANEPAPRIDRAGDDLWILYTGGTTGKPKGVMWPHEHIIALIGRTLDPAGIPLPKHIDEIPAMLEAVDKLGISPRQLAAAPLMHGTSGIGALFTMFLGGAVLTLENRHFDPVEAWQALQAAQASTMTIVGDVFCRPLVEALDDAIERGEPLDIGSLRAVTSSGVMWSKSIKDRLLEHAKACGTDVVLRDSLGASEGVGFASRQSQGDGAAETASFVLGPDGAVITEDGREVEPGSDEVGLLAVSGPIPLGYYGDPVKTAETFREFNGRRWSVPGDWATVAADGSVTLLGRGSVSINTGGEKVFPEEVEEALKMLPEVVDATVVGLPDPKWGAAVTAVVQLDGEAAATDDQTLIDALRTELSGYKLPKNIVRVDKIFRGPNGKADYKWATKIAEEKVLST